VKVQAITKLIRKSSCNQDQTFITVSAIFWTDWNKLQVIRISGYPITSSRNVSSCAGSDSLEKSLFAS